MGIFRQFPYTNFHELNLDWLIETVKKLEIEMDDFIVNWSEELQDAVNNWLVEHPEYTTTVMDGSLTEPKFSDALKLKAIKDYVTPEMFGAVGDGETDDTDAIQSALNNGLPVYFANKVYKLTKAIEFTHNNTVLFADNATLLYTNTDIVISSSLIFANTKNNIVIDGIKFDFGPQVVMKYGMSLLTCNNIRITNSEFTRGFGYSMRLNNSTNIDIRNCYFHNITGGSGNPGGGIYGIGLTNMTVEGCRCDQLYDHFIYLAGGELTNKIIITECICENTGTAGLTNGSAIVCYAECKNVLISDIYFNSCKQAINISRYASEILTPSFISISNIIIENSSENAINIAGLASSYIDNINASNIMILGTGQDGMNIEYVKTSAFNNISVINTARYAISLSGSDNNEFTNIYIYSADTAVLIGKMVTCNRNMFNVMRIRGTGSYGIYFRDASQNRVDNTEIDTGYTTSITELGTNSFFNRGFFTRATNGSISAPLTFTPNIDGFMLIRGRASSTSAWIAITDNTLIQEVGSYTTNAGANGTLMVPIIHGHEYSITASNMSLFRQIVQQS